MRNNIVSQVIKIDALLSDNHPELDEIMNDFMLDYDPKAKLDLKKILEKAGTKQTKLLITKLTMAKKKLTLEESNAQFNALPPKQQMVQIAKDILAQQAAEKFIARGGEYTGLADSRHMGLAIDRSGKKTIQEFLTIDPPVCTVCARGAMMLSRVRLGNSVDQLDVEKMRCDTPIPSIPMDIQKTLEVLFEASFGILGMDKFRDKLSQKRYEEFRSEILSIPWKKADALTVIFQNIIDNKGDYVTKNGVNLTAAIWKKQERDRTKRRKK